MYVIPTLSDSGASFPAVARLGSYLQSNGNYINERVHYATGDYDASPAEDLLRMLSRPKIDFLAIAEELERLVDILLSPPNPQLCAGQLAFDDPPIVDVGMQAHAGSFTDHANALRRLAYAC